MQREQEKRPGKIPARKITPDGLEEQSENIGDTSREGFNLRTERSDTALGRGAPRDSPDSVHDRISRHKKQARQFTEHAAKPAEAQANEYDGGNTLSMTHDSGSMPAVSQTSEVLKKDSSDSNNHSISDEQYKRGVAYQRRFEQPNADKPDTRNNTEAPFSESAAESKLSFDQPQPTQPQVQETLPEDQRPAKDTPLSHERAPRSVPERPGRLRFGGSASAPKDAPQRKPGSPDAAKYIPPDTAVAAASPGIVKDTQPGASKPDGADSSTDTPRHKTESGSKLKSKTAETAVSKSADAPQEKQLRKPGSSDFAKHTPAESAKTDDTETSKPADTESADTEQPTEADARERETPPAAQDSGKGKKPGADQGSTRSRADKSGKLKFTENETPPAADASPSDKKPPGRKLEKAQHKAERSGQKLEKARKNLPKKRSVRWEKVFDEKSGKAKKKLRFEEEVKSQHEHLKGPLITRPVKAGANAAIINAHRKIYQVEHENVGTQAAHRGEMLVEGGLRAAYRMHKTSPYRRVEKLERRTTKLNIKASYQQALHDNPKLKGNMFSRMAQKRKIKKDYAKAAREAKKAAQNAKKAGDVVGKVGQAIVRTVARHPVVFGIIGALFLLVVIISSLFTSCSNMGSGVGGMITATSYLAADADVDNAELYYTEWETDLQMQVGSTESDFPGYDEYRYQVDNVGHNPFELIAYLTVMYHEFHYTDIEAALRQIFAEQYQLTFTPSVETRYSDPEDADGDGDYGEYDWNILTVTLTSRSFTDVISSRMNTEQLQHYSLLIRSKGNRQYAGSPFDFNWLPYVTSYYGYRIHPTSGAKDYHMGIDIGVPIGTDVLAAHGGTVSIGYDAGGYGHYITLTGADGLVTNYAHLDSTLASDGQTVATGDVIAKSGNSGNSTGPHLHFEVIKNGQYLNPIYFSKTNDKVVGPVYGYAGSPMGDGSYAALIAEAELYLGYPYVWGGSSPATSFDCSGYVSWVLTQSGVKNTGRLGAQGLYNICTPVSPAEAQPGDLIFFTGTYSAPLPVTHVGIYVGGGQMIHCGNPIQYTSINTSYWQSHFYAFGRIN